MTHFKAFTIVLLVALLLCVPAFGQKAASGWTTTTLSAAITSRSANQIVIAGNTNVTAYNLVGATEPGGAAAQQTYLYVDNEAMLVTSTPVLTGTIYRVNVNRGQLGTKAATHLTSATVWVGPGSWFLSSIASGEKPSIACPSSASHMPYINVLTGAFWACDAAGNWALQTDKVLYVSPSQCTFAPTTLTTTNTLTTVGSSITYVLNGTSNAAAGTNTLTCNFQLPTRTLAGKGATIWDIETYVGSQTTAPTSIGTATLGTITFPAAATTETASATAPVAAGSTVTTVSPTALTTVTTAGQFLTLKSTFATAVTLNTDHQIVQYTLPFVQSAAAAMTLNTPGLIVHYTDTPQN